MFKKPQWLALCLVLSFASNGSEITSQKTDSPVPESKGSNTTSQKDNSDALPVSSFTADGIINVQSQHSFKDTADNLENILRSNGMTIFARVSHSSDAMKVDIELQPMELIIFGKPQVGGELMKCANTISIDLPLKALVWQDDNKVWIAYNDPEYLKKRHKMTECDMQLTNVAGALEKLTAAAAN